MTEGSSTGKVVMVVGLPADVSVRFSHPASSCVTFHARKCFVAHKYTKLPRKHNIRLVASIPCSSVVVVSEGCSSGTALVTVVTTPPSAVEVMVVNDSVGSSTSVEMMVVELPCSSVVVIVTGSVGSSTCVEVMVVGLPASSVEVKVTTGSSTLVVGPAPGNAVEVVKTLESTGSAR